MGLVGRLNASPWGILFLLSFHTVFLSVSFSLKLTTKWWTMRLQLQSDTFIRVHETHLVVIKIYMSYQCWLPFIPIYLTEEEHSMDFAFPNIPDFQCKSDCSPAVSLDSLIKNFWDLIRSQYQDLNGNGDIFCVRFFFN